MKLLRPQRLSDACAIARADPSDTKFVSGGTAVVLMLQQGLIAPQVLVSLTHIRDVAGWSDIAIDGEDLRIGSGSTLAAVAHSRLVRRYAPALAIASAHVGNTRVRNVATLGGNVAEADYASDPPAVLVALGATFEVSDGAATRRVVASDMFVDYYTTALEHDEVIVGIRIPTTRITARSTYLKYRSRSAEDRPCVGVAAALAEHDGRVDQLSIAVGAVTAIPQYWAQTTDAVRGRTLTRERIDWVAEQYASHTPVLSDARGSGWYRQQMIRTLVRRSLRELSGAGEVGDD